MVEKLDTLDTSWSAKVSGLEAELSKEKAARKEEVDGLRGVVVTMEEEYEGLKGDIRDMEEGWGLERERLGKEREELEQGLIMSKTETANLYMEIDELGQRCRILERERGERK